MAANVTAQQKAHDTLAPNVARKVNLTAKIGDVEVVHHGGSAFPLYVTRAASEPLLNLRPATVLGVENEVVLSGERLQLGQLRGQRSGNWFSVISAGATNYSVIGSE